ncbi:uncharacterized protein [Diadema setosum]|uniref:uncharacterized protein n=1 Tax=Diadema setosum TaxID=31175 RepID=UPI003B3BA34D
MSCLTYTRCQLALLVAVMFSRSAFQMGVIKSVGVFLSSIQASLGESDTGIGVALGVFAASISCPAPIVGYFYGRLPSFSRRMMLISGPFLSSLGVILASLTINYTQITACLALSGIGFSVMLISVMLELSEQASTHFGPLYSIGSMGFAAGMSVIPLLGEFLMNVYGWRGAMLILGGLIGNIMPITVAICPEVPASSRNGSTKEEHNITQEEICGDVSDHQSMEILANGNASCALDCKKSVVRKRAPSMTNPQAAEETEVLIEHSDDITHEMDGKLSHHQDSSFDASSKLKPCNGYAHQAENSRAVFADALRSSEFYQNPSLTLYLAAMAPFGMSYGAWHSFLIPRAISSGLTIYFAILVTVCVALANILSRVFTALVTDKTSRLHEVHLSLTLLNALTVLCDVLIFRSAAIYVTSTLSSFTMASRGILMVVITRQVASPDNRSVAFGFVELLYGLGMFFGPYIAGFAADRFGGFNSSFKCVVGFEFVVFFLVLLSRCKLQLQ